MTRYSVTEYWDIPLWIFLFWGMLIFHVTYLNCFSMSKMSITLLLPMGDLVYSLLVLFGFFVFGSDWDWISSTFYVFLQCWSVLYILKYFKPFLPEYCVFFVDVFFKFIMEHFPITPIIFEVIQLSEWRKHQKCYFCIHFTFTNHMLGRINKL